MNVTASLAIVTGRIGRIAVLVLTSVGLIALAALAHERPAPVSDVLAVHWILEQPLRIEKLVQLLPQWSGHGVGMVQPPQL